MDKTLVHCDKLHDWCTRHRFIAPVYSSTVSGGTVVLPVFRISVRVTDREYSLIDSGTRAALENRCAALALVDLRETRVTSATSAGSTALARSPVVSIAEPPSIIVLVDLDNVDLAVALVNRFHKHLFYLFVARNTPKNYTQYENIPNCTVSIAPTTVKDATDTLMIYESYPLRVKYPDAQFIVYSRDHVAEILAILVRGVYICHTKDIEASLGSG